MSSNLVPDVIILCSFLFVWLVLKPLSEKFGFIKIGTFFVAVMIFVFAAALFYETYKYVGFGILIFCLPLLYGSYAMFRLSFTFPEDKDVFKLSRRE